MIEATHIEEAMKNHRVGSPYHEHAPEYGERWWRVTGELFNVVYWDCVNGWGQIGQVVLTHKDDGAAYRELARFFEKMAVEVEPEDGWKQPCTALTCDGTMTYGPRSFCGVCGDPGPLLENEGDKCPRCEWRERWSTMHFSAWRCDTCGLIERANQSAARPG